MFLELLIAGHFQTYKPKVLVDIKPLEATTQIEPLEPTKLEKLDTLPTIQPKPATSPSNGLNGYVLNSCTGWVATHRYVPPGWGNATNWKYHAQQAGWTVSSIPVAGAIGWTYGHVVYVISVGNGTVTISERNYDYRGSIRTITVPTSKYAYLY